MPSPNRPFIGLVPALLPALAAADPGHGTPSGVSEALHLHLSAHVTVSVAWGLALAAGVALAALLVHRRRARR